MWPGRERERDSAHLRPRLAGLSKLSKVPAAGSELSEPQLVAGRPLMGCGGGGSLVITRSTCWVTLYFDSQRVRVRVRGRVRVRVRGRVNTNSASYS